MHPLVIRGVTVTRHHPPEAGFDEPYTHDEVAFSARRGEGFFCDWRTVIARDSLTPQMFQLLVADAILMLERQK